MTGNLYNLSNHTTGNLSYDGVKQYFRVMSHNPPWQFPMNVNFTGNYFTTMREICCFQWSVKQSLMSHNPPGQFPMNVNFIGNYFTIMREICCFHWKLFHYHEGNIILLNLTKSRNSDSSVVHGTNSNWDFGLLWICTKVGPFFKWNFGDKSLYLLCGKRSYFCRALFLFIIFFLWFTNFLVSLQIVVTPLFDTCCSICCRVRCSVCCSVCCSALQCVAPHNFDFMLLCVLQSVLQCVL